MARYLELSGVPPEGVIAHVSKKQKIMVEARRIFSDDNERFSAVLTSPYAFQQTAVRSAFLPSYMPPRFRPVLYQRLPLGGNVQALSLVTGYAS